MVLDEQQAAVMPATITSNPSATHFQNGNKGDEIGSLQAILVQICHRQTSQEYNITCKQQLTTIAQPTLRRSVGRGHYHQSVAKEVSEEAAQNHGISNVSYLGG